MRVNTWYVIFLYFIVNWHVVAGDKREKVDNPTNEIVIFSGGPDYTKYPVKVSKGPFAKELHFTEKEKKNSPEWRKRLQQELNKPVNFAGHYRLFIDYDNVSRKECNLICGWVIDKHKGKIITGLPWFNGNNACYRFIDLYTPVAEDLIINFYPDSSMIFIHGMNMPIEKSSSVDGEEDLVCGDTAWSFENDKYIQLFSSACEKNY